nr:MAG TPA: hypothetical protein [Caudoviricetes sp.]
MCGTFVHFKVHYGRIYLPSALVLLTALLWNYPMVCHLF